ncbi:DUF5133 domain-containing protein [Streptomyces sp. NPDC002309]
MLVRLTVLKDLVEQYEALRVLHAENGSEAVRQRMDDVAYTLCVTTGTRDVDAALTVAHDRFSVDVADDSRLVT